MFLAYLISQLELLYFCFFESMTMSREKQDVHVDWLSFSASTFIPSNRASPWGEQIKNQPGTPVGFRT